MTDPVAVRLPSMGEGVLEATMVKWLITPPGAVTANQPILEVSTDKVDTEVVAPADGYLIATWAEPGATLAVGQLMGEIAASADATPTLAAEAAATPTAEEQGATAAPRGHGAMTEPSRGDGPLLAAPSTYAGTVRSSPAVRKRARDAGIPLGQIPGSGLHGRITSRDLDRYMGENGGSPTPTGPAPLKTVTQDGVETLEGVTVRREPMTKIRRLTAEHMVRSVQTSPHVTTTFEIDLAAVRDWREKNAAAWAQEVGAKPTYTAFFLAAAVEALRWHPEVNASVDGNDILYKDDINLGCAVAIDSGLIVPVIRRCQDRDFADLTRALDDIVTRARGGQLTPGDVVGGTFSITNPGLFGSVHSQPIINQPQVAILSVGAILERPVPVNGELAIHPLCQVGLTFDHRLIDGEGGARFLATIENYLENFQTP